MENLFIEYDEEAKYLEEFNERPFSNVIIEPEQMCSFISDITGLNPELCNCMDRASFMFLVDKEMISRNKEVDEEYECCKHDCVYNSKGL